MHAANEHCAHSERRGIRVSYVGISYSYRFDIDADTIVRVSRCDGQRSRRNENMATPAGRTCAARAAPPVRTRNADPLRCLSACSARSHPRPISPQSALCDPQCRVVCVDVSSTRVQQLLCCALLINAIPRAPVGFNFDSTRLGASECSYVLLN